MNRKTLSGDVYRSLAVLFTLVAITASGVLLMSQTLDRSAVVASLIPGLLLLAAAAGLWALAGAYDGITARNESAEQTQRDIHSLAKKLEEVSDRVAKLRPQGPGGAIAPAAPQQALPTDSPVVIGALENILRQLEDVRALASLTDDQRRDRHLVVAEELKLRRQREAVEAIDARAWSRADKLLAALEREYPHDGQIAHLRMQFSYSRQEIEARTIAKIAETIEEYMSVSSWDQAYSTARRLSDDFPANTVAGDLLQRVIAGRDLHQDSSAQGLFREIRRHVEQRAWRSALTLATRMLESYPDHRRTEQIRQQFQTIQDNAEIEERQEMEVRIQELVHDGRFDEATALGEELMRRFPASPQAESLEELLPRIRDLAAEQHNAVA
jgi:hypothetical protein